MYYRIFLNCIDSLFKYFKSLLIDIFFKFRICILDFLVFICNLELKEDNLILNLNKNLLIILNIIKSLILFGWILLGNFSILFFLRIKIEVFLIIVSKEDSFLVEVFFEIFKFMIMIILLLYFLYELIIMDVLNSDIVLFVGL